MRYSEAEQARMMSGARTIARKWIHLKARERVLIVTTENHLKEAQLIETVFSGEVAVCRYSGSGGQRKADRSFCLMKTKMCLTHIIR